MLRSAFLRGSKSLVGAQVRRLHVSRSALDARPYKMPAVSPTMDKGNLVEWKCKVGDDLNAGDVLLEVESDKAQVDVEAQDDVKLAKILVGDGAKDVPVGKVIGWLADVDDDLSTLEIPEVEEEPQPAKETPRENRKRSERPKRAKPHASQPRSGSNAAKSNNNILNAANPDQTFLPSVHALLGGNNISREDAIQNIRASGKNGRLLKGDVLAYLGRVSEDSVVKVAEYIKSGEKLDLSNIELRADARPTGQAKRSKPAPVVMEDRQVIQLPAGVTLDQYKASLGACVNRAFHRAHGQPSANTRSQYYDELFESLITPAPTKPRFAVSYELTPVAQGAQHAQWKGGDIFDLLSGSTRSAAGSGSAAGDYVLTFRVQVDDKLPDAEARAKTFVQGLKHLQLR